MNRKVFYDRLRGAYGPFSVPTVTGMEALLDAGQIAALPIWHMAHVLGHVRRETGGYMGPIKETVYASHPNKNPSDATVIARLDTAFRKGQLTWVKTPYWREGWFGRGQIQLTHKTNYAKNSDIAGADLVARRDLALDPRISARIAVLGMKFGRFTGKRLADYTFPEDLDNAPKYNPRRIVNGVDGSDAEVAASTRRYHAALHAAGWNPAERPPVIVTPETPQPEDLADAKPSLISRIIAAIVAAYRNLTSKE